MIQFFVAGKPVPQGSVSAFVSHTTQRIIAPQKPALTAWRKLVGLAARQAIRNYDLKDLKLDDPKALTLVFYLAKPKKPKHSRHITHPDLDKLVRGCLDALTGVLYSDDAQVQHIHATKAYVGADGTTEPGAYVQLRCEP